MTCSAAAASTPRSSTGEAYGNSAASPAHRVGDAARAQRRPLGGAAALLRARPDELEQLRGERLARREEARREPVLERRQPVHAQARAQAEEEPGVDGRRLEPRLLVAGAEAAGGRPRELQRGAAERAAPGGAADEPLVELARALGLRLRAARDRAGERAAAPSRRAARRGRARRRCAPRRRGPRRRPRRGPGRGRRRRACRWRPRTRRSRRTAGCPRGGWRRRRAAPRASAGRPRRGRRRAASGRRRPGAGRRGRPPRRPPPPARARPRRGRGDGRSGPRARRRRRAPRRSRCPAGRRAPVRRSCACRQHRGGRRGARSVFTGRTPHGHRGATRVPPGR